jgi:hypothetical protein
VVVATVAIGSAEVEFLPVADTRHQLDPEQMDQTAQSLRVVVIDIICRRSFGIICRCFTTFLIFRSNYRWMNDAEGAAEIRQKKRLPSQMPTAYFSGL